MRYRIFTNDVGPDAYSGFDEIDAKSQDAAAAAAKRKTSALPIGTKVLVIPHSSRDLWPHGTTGKVPDAAKQFGFKVSRL